VSPPDLSVDASGPGTPPSGCTCQLGHARTSSTGTAALAVLSLLALSLRRRRRPRPF
jgi:hypothetical protein